MTLPGVGFVWVNERAKEAQKTAKCVTHYWDWGPRLDPEAYYQNFCGTAPTHHLFGLREALNMIAEEGLPNVWERHEKLSQAIWAAVDCWAKRGAIELNVADPEVRSHAVTSIRLGGQDGARLRKWTEHVVGVTLGIGLGMESEEDPKGEGFFRIGHMGHVNAHMVLGVLSTIEAGLTALQIPHGEGALDAAAAVIAKG